MSDEKHKGSGEGGSSGSSGSNGTPPPTTIDRLADRYGIVNIGFELKQSGEGLMRTGTVAGEIRGDHRASHLLVVRDRLIELQEQITIVCDYLKEQARKELNTGLRGK